MRGVTVSIVGSSHELVARSLVSRERLGRPTEVEVEVVSAEPLTREDAVGKTAVVVLRGRLGGRAIPGIVTRLVTVAHRDPAVAHTYRLTVRSTIAMRELRRDTRVWQHMTVPEILQQVLVQAGWPAADVKTDRLARTYAKRDYVVQYAETDLEFIHRLCEDEGIFYRVLLADGHEVVSFEDHSVATEPKGPLLLVDANLVNPEIPLVAWNLVCTRKRRAGKITIRDYDPCKPRLSLKATKGAGTPIEQNTEVYVAPARFRSEKDGEARAGLLLERLRADAMTIAFEIDEPLLAPGDAVTIECAPAYRGDLRFSGSVFVVGITTDWQSGSQGASSERTMVQSVPLEVPYRPPAVTPRPHIAGVHSAVVTGAAGAEIHPDENGCIFVRFDWDRTGPKDHKSSLPVRVVQPNTPGSMAIPRVGWEVAVAFEDGDPDRPYVLGRIYNAKTPPPFPLPANKTVTALRTFASPGGARMNSIHFDDAAGRQHVLFDAGFDKSTTIANNMFTQTAKVEGHAIKGNQSRTVSGSEKVSVKQAHISEVKSQTASVGASQHIFVKGHYSSGVGSESVSIGAALLEKVGNPVAGAAALATSAALAGVGALGQSLGPVGAFVAQQASALGGLALAMKNAGGNWRAAGAQGLLGMAGGFVPGGDALVASASSMQVFPWQKPPRPSGAAAAGGGAGGAESDSAAAKGPGPGNRTTIVKGPMVEAIGSSHAVTTPGGITSQITGASLVNVGASYTSRALAVSSRTLGAASWTLGSFHVDAKTSVGVVAKGPLTRSIGGSLTSSASGGHAISGGTSATIKVGGSLTLEGSIVAFIVGDSVVAASPGGVLIKAGTITVKGASTQSDKATHK
jgi:type VI secretion system secreted protein VgrG